MRTELNNPPTNSAPCGEARSRRPLTRRSLAMTRIGDERELDVPQLPRICMNFHSSMLHLFAKVVLTIVMGRRWSPSRRSACDGHDVRRIGDVDSRHPRHTSRFPLLRTMRVSGNCFFADFSSLHPPGTQDSPPEAYPLLEEDLELSSLWGIFTKLFARGPLCLTSGSTWRRGRTR